MDPDGQWDAGSPGQAVSGTRLCLRLCQWRGGQGRPSLGPWGGEGPEQGGWGHLMEHAGCVVYTCPAGTGAESERFQGTWRPSTVFTLIQ